MKKIFLSFLMLASVYNLLAQKTINDANAEKRVVSGFHGISVATGIRLIITEGASEEVVVSASKLEYRDKIVTEVKNGILMIHYDNQLGSINRKKETKDLRAYVSYKALDHLDVTTGAELEINGTLSAPSLDLNANTGGTVNGDINVKTMHVDQNTGSRITLQGKAETLEVDGDTGSKFLGENLKTVQCTATASTGARIEISVEKELSARANTGGNIKYRGEGGIREIKTHTGGSVSKI